MEIGLLDKLFGLLLPVGRWIQGGLSKSRMREQLYREISNNNYATQVRCGIAQSVEGLKQGVPQGFNKKLDITFHIWEHYRDKDSLFHLDEAEAISRIYEKFQRIKKEDLGGYPLVRGKEAMAEVDERLLDGSLDSKIYEKVSNVYSWEYMNRLLKGERESWSKSLNLI